jgi:glucose uptake protein GlcU
VDAVALQSAVPSLGIDDTGLKIVAGSVLASGIVFALVAFKESNTNSRRLFVTFAVALLAWGFYLFTFADISKTNDPKVSACKTTLKSLQVLAQTKVSVINDVSEAKAISQEMLDEISTSTCKP